MVISTSDLINNLFSRSDGCLIMGNRTNVEADEEFEDEPEMEEVDGVEQLVHKGDPGFGEEDTRPAPAPNLDLSSIPVEEMLSVCDTDHER